MSAATLSPFPSLVATRPLDAPAASIGWPGTVIPFPGNTPPSGATPSGMLPPWPEGRQLPVRSAAPVERDPLPTARIVSPFIAVPPVPVEIPLPPPFSVPLKGLAPLMGTVPPPASTAPSPSAAAPSAPAEVPTPAPQAASAPQRDFTDSDLAEALAPVIHHALAATELAREERLQARLEPLLRHSIRRALAEYNPAARPFRAPGWLDRCCWRLLALFTSRTYEEIVFDKTHRFLVEEAFLLDRRSLAMISYASNDPARHASTRRVEATVQRLARQIGDPSATPLQSFSLPDRRTALVLPGHNVLLVCVSRGTPNEMLLGDLDFALRRIEDRFQQRLADDSTPLLLEIQPYLEDCLLVQAPPAV